ncbi:MULTISPECIES: hypothetical protein [unclassified Campylobacter]|uniref:hypothetical protein n=1 Tax=unclassified Campylobacter TaxID=2593542 RepID=UPI001BDA5B88|nr:MULTISPECIES: hypothetical protein [unclassified Campylobacter]MBT0881453.1 hypothetical protein [Campylobacter sp. 2018MI27]MBT0884826.1 hypothetical protein [Campylobacter sp. 2018MI10]
MKEEKGLYTIEEVMKKLDEPIGFKNGLKLYLYKKPMGFIRYIWFDFGYGIKNLFRFFKVIWQWRHWDAHYELMVLKKILEVKHQLWLDDVKHQPYEGQNDDIRAIKDMIETLDKLKACCEGENLNDLEELKYKEKFIKIYQEKGINLWN